MISNFNLSVECLCGHRHGVPLDTQGRLAFVCAAAVIRGKRPEVVQLQVAASQWAAIQRQYNALTLEMQEHVVPVHIAAEAVHDKQSCANCGTVLLDYSTFRQSHPSLPVAWYKAGAYVGVTPQGVTFYTQAPLAPFREQWCHASRVQ